MSSYILHNMFRCKKIGCLGKMHVLCLKSARPRLRMREPTKQSHVTCAERTLAITFSTYKSSIVKNQVYKALDVAFSASDNFYISWQEERSHLNINTEEDLSCYFFLNKVPRTCNGYSLLLALLSPQYMLPGLLFLLIISLSRSDGSETERSWPTIQPWPKYK